MQEGIIIHFRTMDELQLSLGKELDSLKKRTDEYSGIIGEKLREVETSNPTDMAELKEKLEGPSDPKKKQVKKKDKNTNWHNFGDILVYDGMGLKGELDLYFKALDAMKSKLEKLQKAKNSIDELISKGLKKDLGCAILVSNDLIFEMVFIKTNQPKAKFSYKSIFDVGVEQIHEIKI